MREGGADLFLPLHAAFSLRCCCYGSYGGVTIVMMLIYFLSRDDHRNIYNNLLFLLV